MFRKENGVTLVALVITIIVLLILAGVTISMVLGDDGILNNASTATAESEEANIENLMQLASLTVRTDVLGYENGVATRTGSSTVYDRASVIKVFNANSDIDAAEGTAATDIKVEGTYATYNFTIDLTAKTVTVATGGHTPKN